FGQQASDADGAVLWAAVAERLGRPVVSQAAELTLQDGSLRVKRQTEFGYDVIETPLPAVVAVSDAINEPRYPSLKGIMGAKKKPFNTLALGDIGVDAAEAGEHGSKTEVQALGDPPSRGDARKIEDEGNAAQANVESGLAARLDAGLNWDLVDLTSDFVGKRPALQDSVLVDVGWKSTPRLALFRAGSFDAAATSGGEPQIEEIAVELQPHSQQA